MERYGKKQWLARRGSGLAKKRLRLAGLHISLTHHSQNFLSYLLPEIHKLNNPGLPIVSAYNCSIDNCIGATSSTRKELTLIFNRSQFLSPASKIYLRNFGQLFVSFRHQRFQLKRTVYALVCTTNLQPNSHSYLLYSSSHPSHALRTYQCASPIMFSSNCTLQTDTLGHGEESIYPRHVLLHRVTIIVKACDQERVKKNDA